MEPILAGVGSILIREQKIHTVSKERGFLFLLISGLYSLAFEGVQSIYTIIKREDSL